MLPYDRVMEIRRWHRSSSWTWDRPFAIVDLPASAATEPPEQREPESWQLSYGGNWQQTPWQSPGDTARDALGHCSLYLSDDTAVRPERAVSEPGSWAIRDDAGETLFVYAAPERIAARVHLGD